VSEPLSFDLPEPELTIRFDPPIQFQGMTCDQIELREPTAAEVRAAEGHLRKGMTPESIRMYQLTLIQKVSGKPQQVIDAMPISKVVLAAEYLQGFVLPNPATGQS